MNLTNQSDSGHSCKLCGGRQVRALNKKVLGSNSAQVQLCIPCDYAFLNNVDLPSNFYESEFNTFMADRAADTSWEDAEKHFQSRVQDGIERIHTLEKYLDLKRISSVLELGSSSGFLLQAFRQLYPSIRTAGVEPGKRYLDFARSKDLRTYSHTSELDEKFDCILSYFVLEHIHEPLTWLRDLKTLTKSPSSVVVVVPNLNEALISAYHDSHYDKFVWQAPHLSYFSAKSLAKLFSQLTEKFEVHHFQRYSLSNHLNWLSGMKPKLSEEYPHITADINSLYKSSLEEKGLGDTLIGILHFT